MQVPPPYSMPAAGFPPPPRRVRFEAISEGWKLYTSDIGQWILAVLLYLILVAAPAMLIAMAVAINPQNVAAMAASQTTAQKLLSVALTAPLTFVAQMLSTGLYYRGVLQARGERTPVTQMFNLNGMGGQVALYAIALIVIGLPVQLLNAFATSFAKSSGSGFMLLGIEVILYVVAAVVQLLLLFAPLVMVDQKRSAGEAMSESFRTLGSQFFPILGVMIAAGVLAGLGFIGCGVGVLFTVGSLFPIVGIIYNDFYRPAAPVVIESESGYPRPGY